MKSDSKSGQLHSRNLWTLWPFPAHMVSPALSFMPFTGRKIINVEKKVLKFLGFKISSIDRILLYIYREEIGKGRVNFI